MKRFLSVIAVLCGIGIIAYSIYLMTIRIFTGDFFTRNMVFLIIGIIFLLIGILGNIKISKKQPPLLENRHAKMNKRNRTVAIAVGATAISIMFLIAMSLILQNAAADHVDKTFRPFIKSEYTQIGVSIPDNPKYILYNVNKRKFETEANSVLKFFSANPNKVNVVVAYTTGAREIGSWKTVGGMFISKGIEETIEIEVIRLSDWSLIEDRTFTPLRSDQNLGKGDDRYTYQISLYDSQIVDYLNNLFSTE